MDSAREGRRRRQGSAASVRRARRPRRRPRQRLRRLQRRSSIPAISPQASSTFAVATARDTGDTCLSDAQIAAANAVSCGRCRFRSRFRAAGRSVPGWPTGGESRPAIGRLGMRPAPEPTTPASLRMALSSRTRAPTMLVARTSRTTARGSRNCRRCSMRAIPICRPSAARRQAHPEGEHDRLHGQSALVLSPTTTRS